MGKGSKKGRLTGSQRKELNERAVQSVMEEEVEGVEFGRVIKHLGNAHVQVILSNKREGIAKIRTALSRRGSTPIVADDIVILSGREFEKPGEKPKYDLLGVLSRSNASKMEREGRIPSWMLVLQTSDAVQHVEEGDLFDYTNHKEAEEEDSDIDVDKI
jgi:translation initiation factor IF-1